jgi:DNA-binding FrmR family transcriptional regulator
MVEEEEISQDILLKRLRRIEGQVRGIRKMIVDGRDCESLVTQLAAIRSAVESVGALVLNNYMKLCFRKDTESEPAGIDSLARAIAIWGRVRVGDQT